MEELLTVDELAAKLKVSHWTIRAWCSQEYIPFFKLCDAVSFRESEIEKWLKKNIRIGRSVRRIRIGAAMASEKVSRQNL